MRGIVYPLYHSLKNHCLSLYEFTYLFHRRLSNRSISSYLWYMMIQLWSKLITWFKPWMWFNTRIYSFTFLSYCIYAHSCTLWKDILSNNIIWITLNWIELRNRSMTHKRLPLYFRTNVVCSRDSRRKTDLGWVVTKPISSVPSFS